MDRTLDAQATLSSLWAAAAMSGAAATPVPGSAEVKALAQALGEHAMRCVGDTLGGRREALVASSADVMQTLVALWVACGLAPEEIWTELHKREQLGSLLMQLNQAPSRAPRRLLKPWRVDSTKLP